MPNLPNDFFLIVKQCCEAAAKCCENTLSQDQVDYFKKTYDDKLKTKKKMSDLNVKQITTQNYLNNASISQSNNGVSLNLSMKF